MYPKTFSISLYLSFMVHFICSSRHYYLKNASKRKALFSSSYSTLAIRDLNILVFDSVCIKHGGSQHSDLHMCFLFSPSLPQCRILRAGRHADRSVSTSPCVNVSVWEEDSPGFTESSGWDRREFSAKPITPGLPRELLLVYVPWFHQDSLIRCLYKLIFNLVTL